MKFSKSSRINLALYRMGLFSYYDVVLYLPKRYENFALSDELKIADNERLVIYGRLIGSATLLRFKKISITKFIILSSRGNFYYVNAWNRPYLAKNLVPNENYTVVGNLDKTKNILNLITIVKGQISPDKEIKPIYTLPRLIEQHEFLKIEEKAIANLTKEDIPNIVPNFYIDKYRLIDKYDAIKNAHFPTSYSSIKESHRHLKYEECLLFSLKSLLIREETKAIFKHDNVLIDKSKIEKFIGDLPYILTDDQKNAVGEIIDDMNLETSMYRLLQGDVGSGKTLVSLIALYANYLRGNQGAIMAPTEALAKQHYAYIAKLLQDKNIKVALLLGSSTLKERSAVRKALYNGEIDIIIGTHVLFSKDIDYNSLGLVIIDEQHKFGVNQRHLLANKGESSDLLMLSATPIPRSLALTIYGDLDVSTLLSFPFAKKDVETLIVANDTKKIDSMIKNALANNGRVYVIAPRIEGIDDELSVSKLFDIYAKKYPLKVALLHGKLDEDDKNFALTDFKNGEKPILVSTSVVEVGIDIKEANLMLVYEPSFFGLASLHQLRGRIGRNGQKAYFVMVADELDEDETNKLNVLVQTNDGFKIAEEDLKRRGPGELIGKRQSGLVDFAYVNIINDYKMFVISREDAKYILKNRNYADFLKIIEQAKKSIDEDVFLDV